MNLANSWNVVRYSVYTPFYDLVAGLFSTYRRKSISNLVFEGDELVLIIGAGTGLDLKYFPDNVRITATDITPSMLFILRQRARRQHKKVTVKRMDGQQLAVASHSVDVVVLHLILAVIPDPVACLQECERVLKAGGQLIIFDKFMPADQKTNPGRRITGWVANILFSDINRKIEPIVAETNLIMLHNEPAAMGGLFRFIRLKKT